MLTLDGDACNKRGVNDNRTVFYQPPGAPLKRRHIRLSSPTILVTCAISPLYSPRAMRTHWCRTMRVR